jgi:protein tyrosine phosphatase
LRTHKCLFTAASCLTPVCLHCRYGIYKVQAVGQTDLDNDITVRELHLTDSVTSTSRRIMHYHYHAWPDHGVPESTGPLRRLSHLLRRTKLEGIPVVHCSAGIFSPPANVLTVTLPRLRGSLVGRLVLPLMRAGLPGHP